MNIQILTGASRVAIAFIITAMPLSVSRAGMTETTECGGEYKPGMAIANSGNENHGTRIWTCQNRRAAAPVSAAILPSPPPTTPTPPPPEEYYKLGFTFTPTYLTSPQIGPSGLRPNTSSLSVNPR